MTNIKDAALSVPCVIGPRPDFRWIDIDKLIVNVKYQRQVSKDGRTLIGLIAREFDWAKFTPITVAKHAEKKGKYYIIDGQHRTLAILKHPELTDVPCWIVDAPEISRQATAFIGLNKNRIKMMPVSIYHAKLAAGDPQALALAAVCAAAGVIVMRKHISSLNLKENETLAVAALGNAVKRFGAPATIEALKIIVANLQGINKLRATTIMVVTNIVALGRHADSFDLDRLKKVLAAKDVDIWIEAAKSYTKNFGGGAASCAPRRDDLAIQLRHAWKNREIAGMMYGVFKLLDLIYRWWMLWLVMACLAVWKTVEIIYWVFTYIRVSVG